MDIDNEKQNKAMDIDVRFDDATCGTQSHQFKKDIKLRDVYSVEGYIRLIFTEPYNTNVCQDILDLVLFLYAKPLMLKVEYSDQCETVLYYPSHDTWHSIAHRIKAQFVCSSRVVFLAQGNGTIKYNEYNWQSCKWNEQHVFEMKLVSKRSSIDVLQNQIEVLSSKASKARSLLLCVKSQIRTETMRSGFVECIESIPNNILDRIFDSKSEFEKGVDARSLLSLLSLITLIAMIHQLGYDARPRMLGPMKKGCVEHLAAWVIRNFGEKTGQKKHISVQDDAGNTVQGKYSVCTLKVQKNTFLRDFRMWVDKYIEMDGEINNN